MNWLTGTTLGLQACWILLIIGSVVGRPPGMVCQCSVIRTKPHLTSEWLFVQCLLSAVLAVLAVVAYGWASISWLPMLCFAAFSFWRWWRHTKNDRKKLADKILGRVRNLGWKLSVEPVPVR